MVKVKMFGLFRLDTGLKEFESEVSTVRELYPVLLKEAKRLDPNTTITVKDIDGCVVMVNGRQGNKRSKLKDGDRVTLMSPVCGG